MTPLIAIKRTTTNLSDIASKLQPLSETEQIKLKGGEDIIIYDQVID